MNIKNIQAILLLIIVGCLCYSNTLNNGFVWDDQPLVTENPHIRSLDSISSFFFDPKTVSGKGLFFKDIYRPITLLSFAIDYKFWKLNPRFYHLENVAFHIADALLLYLFILLAFDNGLVALFSSLIFLVHPVSTEAVTWISGRGNVLSVFWYLATLIFYTAYCKYRKKIYYIISLAACLIAVFSKEIAVTIPLAVMLFIALNKDRERNEYLCTIPYFLISIFYVSVRYILLGRMSQVGSWAPIYERMLTMSKAAVSYLCILIYPLRLCADRAIFIIHSIKDPAAFTSLFILGIAVYIAVYFRDKHKAITYSIFFFFITLLPVSNIISMDLVLADRFLYLPSIGFSLFVSYLFYRLIVYMDRKKLKSAVYAVFIIIIILLGSRTILRNNDWKNDEIFCRENLKLNADSARLHYNLALALLDGDNLKEAAYEFKKAIALKSEYSDAAHYNLGIILTRSSDLKGAAEEFKKAISLKDDYIEAYNNLGNVYALLGDKASSLKCFERSIAVKPNAVAYNNIGIAYFETGDYDKAITNYQEAILLDRDYAAAHLNLGNAYYSKGDIENAKISWREVLRIDPSNKMVEENLRILGEK